MPKTTVTNEITDEVFKTLRKLFKRTTPHASFAALLEESRKPEHSVHTDGALKYWLAPFEHDKKKTPELEGATRIQAYVNFSLLHQIEQQLEADANFAATIDEAEPTYRQGNVVNTIARLCITEAQVEEVCRPRIANTEPLDMLEVWQEALKERTMTDDNHVLQQVLIGVVDQIGLKSSINPAKVVNEAITTLTGNAWEGLGRRPNWTGAQVGVLSERRTAARFKEIRDVLEMPVFDRIGNI